jgi:predicted transcriptional regulator
MPIMTIRLSRQESARLARLAKKKGVTRSDVVRQALEVLEERDSALDAWGDAVGVAEGGPKDLATNPRHLKGYGR